MSRPNVHTELVGRELVFDMMPNEALSCVRCRINTVRMHPRSGELVFTVETPDGRLHEWTGTRWFTLVPKYGPECTNGHAGIDGSPCIRCGKVIK